MSRFAGPNKHGMLTAVGSISESFNMTNITGTWGTGGRLRIRMPRWDYGKSQVEYIRASADADPPLRSRVLPT